MFVVPVFPASIVILGYILDVMEQKQILVEGLEPVHSIIARSTLRNDSRFIPDSSPRIREDCTLAFVTAIMITGSNACSASFHLKKAMYSRPGTGGEIGGI